MNENATVLASVIDPQVLAPMIDWKMIDLIKFAPLATIDTTLQGRPGSTISLPKYTFIGIAADVAEGDAIPVRELTAASEDVTIKKFGIGVELTDETLLSGFGDPKTEAINQMAKSMAAKIDNDVLAVLGGIQAGMTYTLTGSLSAKSVATALVLFGEEVDEKGVLLIAPEQLGQIRNSEGWFEGTDLGVAAMMAGTVGTLWGHQVVVSNKVVKANNSFVNYLVKPGALRIFLKRDLQVETGRDMDRKLTKVNVDRHCVAYLYDETKAIKIVTTEPVSG